MPDNNNNPRGIPAPLNVILKAVSKIVRVVVKDSTETYELPTGDAAARAIYVQGTGTITGSVTVTSSVLPTGAATETTLSALNTKVTACNTGAVTVSSSALPSGAATETTLSALNTKVTACNTGAVVISSGTVTAVTSITNAVAVTTVKPDGSNTAPSMDAITRPGYVREIISGRNTAFADTSFVTGDPPATLDVNAALGRNGTAGFIACDGAGNIQVEISDNGTDYGTAFNMEADEVLSLDGINVDTIRLTWIADSSYRVAVW